MKLQTSFYHHFRAVSSQLFFIFLLFVLYLFFHQYEGALTIILIGFALDAVPAFFLHFEYYYYNRNEIYTITSHRITQWKGEEKHVYDTEDIKKIILYKSASMDAGGMPIASIESYYYARIITQSGEELIITRLLTPEVEKAVRQLKGVPIERVKRPFCPIFWKRLGNPDI